MIRAKFKVHSKTERMGSRRVAYSGPDPRVAGIEYRPCVIVDVRLAPVMGDGSPENQAFYNASPSGEIILGCANAEAAAGFILDREYYVDFTPAN